MWYRSILLAFMPFLIEGTGTTQPIPPHLQAAIALVSSQAIQSDVIRLLGEPRAFTWGNQSFSAMTRPMAFLMNYGSGICVLISNNRLSEIRIEAPGLKSPEGLVVGQTFEDVWKEMGQIHAANKKPVSHHPPDRTVGLPASRCPPKVLLTKWHPICSEKRIRTGSYQVREQFICPYLRSFIPLRRPK